MAGLYFAFRLCSVRCQAPPVVNLTDIYHDRTHLQHVKQHLVTSLNALREGEGFLWALTDVFLKDYGAQEQKCLQYCQATT